MPSRPREPSRLASRPSGFGRWREHISDAFLCMISPRTSQEPRHCRATSCYDSVQRAMARRVALKRVMSHFSLAPVRDAALSHLWTFRPSAGCSLFLNATVCSPFRPRTRRKKRLSSKVGSRVNSLLKCDVSPVDGRSSDSETLKLTRQDRRVVRLPVSYLPTHPLPYCHSPAFLAQLATASTCDMRATLIYIPVRRSLHPAQIQ